MYTQKVSIFFQKVDLFTIGRLISCQQKINMIFYKVNKTQEYLVQYEIKVNQAREDIAHLFACIKGQEKIQFPSS